MRHIKIGAVLTISAAAFVAFVGTATASASSVAADVSGAELSGAGLAAQVFSVEDQEVQCSSVDVEGVTEGTLTAAQRAHPLYGGCAAFGFLGATGDTGSASCVFDLQAAVSPSLGDVMIEGCSSGIVIAVSNAFATCEVEIEDQTLPGAASCTNSGGEIDIQSRRRGSSLRSPNQPASVR